ncbi:MAG: pilus assembly protein PilP [Desulfobacterales bacterium]
MAQYLIIIRSFVFVICFLPLLWGCGKQSEPPPKAKVITRKIIIANKDASQSKKPNKIPQKTVVLKPPSKKETAKPKPVETVEPLPKSKVITKKIIIAKKDESKPQKPKKIEVAKPALKKEPVKPKPEAAKKEPVKPKPKAAKKEPVKPKPEAAHDVSKAKADVSARKSVASLTATTQITPDTIDFYNPEGKLDPFASLYKYKPVAVSTTGQKLLQEPRRPLTPLEKVDLSQLKLVAIIRALSGNIALVEEASGKGYVIKKGTYIGTRSGKVGKILPDRIIVEEESEDFSGKVSVREIEVKLNPSGEE